MALPSTGAVSVGQINAELGREVDALLSTDDPEFLELIGKNLGDPMSFPADLYGVALMAKSVDEMFHRCVASYVAINSGSDYYQIRLENYESPYSLGYSRDVTESNVMDPETGAFYPMPDAYTSGAVMLASNVAFIRFGNDPTAPNTYPHKPTSIEFTISGTNTAINADRDAFFDPENGIWEFWVDEQYVCDMTYQVDISDNRSIRSIKDATHYFQGRGIMTFPDLDFATNPINSDNETIYEIKGAATAITSVMSATLNQTGSNGHYGFIDSNSGLADSMGSATAQSAGDCQFLAAYSVNGFGTSTPSRTVSFRVASPTPICALKYRFNGETQWRRAYTSSYFKSSAPVSDVQTLSGFLGENELITDFSSIEIKAIQKVGAAFTTETVAPHDLEFIGRVNTRDGQNQSSLYDLYKYSTISEISFYTITVDYVDAVTNSIDKISIRFFGSTSDYFDDKSISASIKGYSLGSVTNFSSVVSTSTIFTFEFDNPPSGLQLAEDEAIEVKVDVI